MYIIGVILLVFFAVIGVSCFIAALKKSSLYRNTSEMILLMPNVEEENAEVLFRTARAVREEIGSIRVIAVCGDGKSGLIGKLAEEFRFVEITRKEELEIVMYNKTSS